MVSEKEPIQPQINIGFIGHVDSGKTSLLEKLSGVWADTHSEEIKRGITIRLGYADISFYKCKKCNIYTKDKKCPNCKGETEFARKVSFVDAPGHETLMATMLSGAAIMDAAILLIAADEECPQPQTKEHLIAISLIGIKNIIIIQNKIDLVDKEQAIKNYNQIKEFIKGTIAEKAEIIPVSVKHNININKVIESICNLSVPTRDTKKEPLMLVARSFDVNKPGMDLNKLVGGVLGGALKQGILKIGDKIELRPGIKIEEHNKTNWKVIQTEILDLKTGSKSVKEVIPGGSIGILTSLDPSIVKSDTLVGNIVGHVGKLPDIFNSLDLEIKLLEKVVGEKEEIKVELLRKGEALMLNVNSAITLGIITELAKGKAHLELKRPICAGKEDRFAVSRMINNRWRLIGYGMIKQ
ncbi:MAG: translation initiation factor IF-2 subunit gamma [Candidatus Nanoarchaeia archaeon]